MNQKEHNPTNPDHSDSFPANFEQRRYLHEVDSFEQRAAWNSSSSSCFQPSKHHGRHGEPFYRSLLKPHHCSQPPFVEYVEGVQHRHHNPYLFETESPAVAGSCFSPQYVNYSPCSCGSPMSHESNTRKGQSYHLSSTLQNEITLHNWYLIRSGDSHTSDIAVGGFLSSRCNEVDRVETTTIVKRLEERKLLTKDGDVINLLGPIDDYRTVSNGFHLQTAHLFMSGFPHIWNLLVGMGLPAKAAGTTSSSRSCDFHGGEVTFQERLWKDTSGQRGYMEHLPAFKESETDQVFYPEGERSCGAKYATKASCAEINEIIPENAVQTEQDISVVDGACQSKEDPLILHTQAQDKDVDKNVGAKHSCAERTEHEAAHIWKSTLNGPAEAYDPGYEMENMPIESMDTAVSGTACGNRESELVTETKSKKDAKEKIYANKAFDSGAKADNVCRGNLDLATVLPFQMSKGELGMAKLSETLSESAKRKRKVAFSSANDVEGEDLSSASLSLENSARSVEKSCNMFSRKGEELISSVISIAKENVVVACKATAKKKRKQKRRGRNSIARSKRSTKSTVAKVRDLNNVPLESIEAAVSEGAFENKDSDVTELKKIKNSEEEKNHASEVFAETTADAGAEADKTCREIVYLATAQRIQTDEGELAMEKSSKTLHGSSLKKRKVAFCSANDMEGRDLSSAILNLEFSARSMEKSCSWLCEDKDEVISSVVSVAKQKGVVAKKAIAKRKGMHKRTGRLILASSERSSKPTAQVDIEMSAYAGKQPKDFFDDKQLAGGLKKTKSIMLKERQVAADAAAGKTAEPVSDFISTIRTRGASQKLNANKGVQTKSILKDDKSFAKLQDLSSKTNLNINPNMKSALLHPVAVGVANLHGNVPVISRPQKQGGKHLDEAKSSKRLETMDSKTSTFVSDPLKENCSAQSYDGLSSLASVQKITKSSKRLETLELKENCSGQSRDGIGLSSMASAQKRMKMLPPPLPSPLMSVSRQLVSKAFGLKTSKSGRLLVPPLAHWRGQSVVRDMDGGIIAIEDGSNSVPAETGCFNFKPPIEARAKKLQEWLSETASKCLSKKLTARRKGNQSKLGPK